MGSVEAAAMRRKTNRKVMPYPLGHVVFVECAVVAAVVEAATHAADLDLLLDPGGAALERHGDPRLSDTRVFVAVVINEMG